MGDVGKDSVVVVWSIEYVRVGSGIGGGCGIIE